MESGFNDYQTKQLIGQYVAYQLLKIIKSGNSNDNNRDIGHLIKLSKEPARKYRYQVIL